MNDTLKATSHFLQYIQTQPFNSNAAMITAAAATILETACPGEAAKLANTVVEPSIAFIIGTAVVTVAPTGRHQWLADLGRAVPPGIRLEVMSNMECLLARIDPEWAWLLIQEILEEDAIMTHGSLGLIIAAYADRKGIPSNLASGWYKPQETYARQLIADNTARSAIRGEITSPNHPALAPLHNNLTECNLSPWEASSYLVAAAAINPDWALELANRLLQLYEPDSLKNALYLVARAADRAGLGFRVVEQVSRQGFVAEQATWLAAAAQADILKETELTQLAYALAPRVTDELDPDRELIAGLPLLLALAYQGAIKPLAELVLEWQVSPPLLANEIFYGEARIGAAILQAYPTWQRLLETEFEAHHQHLICQDVLAITASSPWSPFPGSLADIVHWE